MFAMPDLNDPRDKGFNELNDVKDSTCPRRCNTSEKIPDHTAHQLHELAPRPSLGCLFEKYTGAERDILRKPGTVGATPRRVAIRATNSRLRRYHFRRGSVEYGKFRFYVAQMAA